MNVWRLIESSHSDKRKSLAMNGNCLIFKKDPDKKVKMKLLLQIAVLYYLYVHVCTFMFILIACIICSFYYLIIQ